MTPVDVFPLISSLEFLPRLRYLGLENFHLTRRTALELQRVTDSLNDLKEFQVGQTDILIEYLPFVMMKENPFLRDKEKLEKLRWIEKEGGMLVECDKLSSRMGRLLWQWNQRVNWYPSRWGRREDEFDFGTLHQIGV